MLTPHEHQFSLVAPIGTGLHFKATEFGEFQAKAEADYRGLEPTSRVVHVIAQRRGLETQDRGTEPRVRVPPEALSSEAA